MIPSAEIVDFEVRCRANEEGLHHVRLVDALVKSTRVFTVVRVERSSDELIRFSFDTTIVEISVPVATARMRQLCARLANVLSASVMKEVSVYGDDLDADIPTGDGHVAKLHVRFSNKNGNYFLELTTRDFGRQKQRALIV